MDQLARLRYAVEDLQGAIRSIDAAQMDTVSNCAPWTLRQLASHALNNQLVWGGLVTGQELVSFDATMGGVPYDGDLSAYAGEVAAQSPALWSGEGVLAAAHATPFGELPGSVVVTFPTFDALAHAWDISTSLGRTLEFDDAEMAWIAEMFAVLCTDAVRATGLIKAVTPVPDDATATEHAMALAGRQIPR